MTPRARVRQLLSEARQLQATDNVVTLRPATMPRRSPARLLTGAILALALLTAPTDIGPEPDAVDLSPVAFYECSPPTERSSAPDTYFRLEEFMEIQEPCRQPQPHKINPDLYL